MPEITEMLDPVVADVRTVQLESWEKGERVHIEAILNGKTLSDDALLDLIYAEVLLREEFNERPTSEEYERRFPRLADAIRRQMDLHAALGDMQTLNDDTLGFPRRDDDASRPDWIDEYEILREVGRGGMGIVYLGRHRVLANRLFALKVIRSGASTEDAEEWRRFVAEARIVAQLNHSHIVQLHHYGTFHHEGEERPFVALDYVEGGSLTAAMNGTPLSPHEAAALLIPLAEAMAYAHGKGIIHRDLKPANILLKSKNETRNPKPESGTEPSSFSGFGFRFSDFEPIITDFGLAKCFDADSSQTQTGAILGTPSYMAPEQATGRYDAIGPACDIYALGSILYEMLTGRPPFRADTVLNTLNQVVHLEPVPPRTLNPDIPRDLETICLKCLQKATSKRYSTSTALAEEVRRYLQGEPILARPTSLVERALKWVKRRPAAATLTAVSVASVVGLIALWGYFTIQLQDEKKNALEQRDDAIRQKAYAVEQQGIAKLKTEEAIKQSQRAAHLLTLTATSVDEIALSARAGKSAELESKNTGTILFKLACTYAKTSANLSGDDALILEDRNALADQYARSAVRLLKCAQQVGFFDVGKSPNREELKTNPDLTCLRSRDDFKQLVASVK